jgi:hypothetical protein
VFGALDRPRFLFASTGVPGQGGAASACYELFRRVQESGRAVTLVNLIKERTGPEIRSRFGPSAGNPMELTGVHCCDVTSDPTELQPALRKLVAALDPHVIVAFDHRAAGLLISAAPATRVVFVAATCRQAQDFVVSGRATDAVALADALATGRIVARRIHREEARAFSGSALVIANSGLTLSMLERFYQNDAGKLYPSAISFAEWICESPRRFRHLSRPFDERDADVCFVATDWSRPEKNYPWVEAIARRLDAGRVRVVGEVPRAIPGAVHHGFVATREALYDLLGRARSVVSVSRIDAAPGILFEASVMGCNVVASRNCGNWELCHRDLLVDPFSVGGYVDAIGRARERKYEDQLDAFLARASYADFVATLDAFARPFETVDA